MEGNFSKSFFLKKSIQPNKPVPKSSSVDSTKWLRQKLSHNAFQCGGVPEFIIKAGFQVEFEVV